jgi:hypothetical protein
MSNAIAALSTPILLEICDWGNAQVWTWGASIGQSWRMTGDVQANWNSIISIVASNVQHLNSVNFYAHNDMDMMVSREVRATKLLLLMVCFRKLVSTFSSLATLMVFDDSPCTSQATVT